MIETTRNASSVRAGRAVRLSWLVAVVALLAGCASLPTEGPIVQADGRASQGAPEVTGIDARPPSTGATRAEIVTGFLAAMTAWPINTSVAKQYLTRDAASQWNPERATLVYGESLRPREVGSSVEVQLTRADRLDEVGAWQGPVAKDDLNLSIWVTVEKGEYRIADPPDALIVPATWFQQRYRQVSLYYFDPGGQVLVPEPVFVPVGEQLATRLVTSLLAGPPSRARNVVRTFLPSGRGVGLSVPIDDDGIAEVTLDADVPQLSAEGSELMLAQLAWTLRQVPDITGVRVRIGGVDIPAPGGVSEYRVESARRFDPSGSVADRELYALSGGRVFNGQAGDLRPVSGAFGDDDANLESVAVRPDGEIAAAVDQNGSRVRRTTVDGSGEAADVVTLLAGGDYRRPTWDGAGRLWVVDGRPQAVVWLLEEGRAPRQITVPGLSGEQVTRIAVSRDGTRLVGVVTTARGDEVRAVRVKLGAQGQVSGVAQPTTVRKAAGYRVTDLAWAAGTRIALLTATAPGSLYEVDVVSSDGASVGVDAPSTVVTGRVIGLATAPTEGAPLLAVYDDSYEDIARGDQYAASDAEPLMALDFAG